MYRYKPKFIDLRYSGDEFCSILSGIVETKQYKRACQQEDEYRKINDIRETGYAHIAYQMACEEYDRIYTL